MNNMETSISILEKKLRHTTTAVIVLSVMVAIMALGQFFTVDMNQANAQNTQYDGYIITPTPTAPMAIEAQSFILKDKQGNIRGMWSAEDENTTFATAYKNKEPFISMIVDETEATMTVSDDNNNQILLSNSKTDGQSLTMGNVTNASHNVLLGYKNEETNLELIARQSSRIGLSGNNVLVEALGRTADFVIAEETGNYINLNTDKTGAKISFVDAADYENIRIEYKKGQSIITLISPRNQGKTIIDAMPK